MKKFLCIILVMLSMTFCIAQRPVSSGSNSRGSHPTPVSSSRSSVSHSSTRSSGSISRSNPTRSSVSSSRSSVSHSSTRSSGSISRSNSSGFSSRQNSSSFSSSTRTETPTRNSSRSRGDISRQSHNQRPGGETPHNQHHPIPQGHPIPHGMHPQPPMHHPIHHHHIHMHHCHITCWHPIDYHWCGYWEYAHYHPYNEVVIYAANTYPNQEIIYLVTTEEYIYTIVRDRWENKTYFQISDRDDHVVVRTPIHRKYQSIVLDENGVWLFKPNDRDPLYFMYSGGSLYKYEQD